MILSTKASNQYKKMMIAIDRLLMRCYNAFVTNNTTEEVVMGD